MTVLIDFHFDFETRSRVDLTEVGPVNYATHPSTEATLITWCFGRTGAVKSWRYGMAFPTELEDVAKHPEKYNFIAHNIPFDFLIWTVPFKRKFPFIVPPKIQNLTDNMALTQHYRVGASLESAAKLLDMPFNKDKRGKQLMLKQCKPGRNGEFPILTDTEWDEFEHYGITDTRLLREIYYKLPALPVQERWAWEWTFKRNLIGIKVDVPLVKKLNDMVDNAMPALVDEFFRLTCGSAPINSPTKTVVFFKQYYPWIENMQADTVRDMLLDSRPVPAFVRRALEIKDLAGSTSISKLKRALQIIYSGRIYNILAYHQAQTKRWAGRGIQIQNFPRPDHSRPDKIKFDMNVKDITPAINDMVIAGLKDPIGFCKNVLRRIWLPDEGNIFYCGDWSKIEPTVLFWLTGLGAIPPKWYEDMAATIYNKHISEISKDSDERQVGKTANLSCGYGSGSDSFVKKLYQDTGIVMSKEMGDKVVRSYRTKYKEVVALWYQLEGAFKSAIYGHTTKLCDGKVMIFPLTGYVNGVAIRLPSGGHLFYPHAKINSSGSLEYMADFGKGKVLPKNIYGGLITENVVSAISREIILPAMYKLEERNFDVLNLIHDEIWAQSVAGRDEEFVNTMCERPSWALDMEIGAECKNGERYLK